MLRHGWLLQSQTQNNVAHRALLQRQIVQDFPAARLGHRIESVGGGSGSCHGTYNTFRYGHMSSTFFCGRITVPPTHFPSSWTGEAYCRRTWPKFAGAIAYAVNCVARIGSSRILGGFMLVVMQSH